MREQAAAAVAAGKHKRALAAYLELERIEPGDAQWAKRAGETYRRLGNSSLAIAAFERSAERYAQNGFLVQAIAVCKVILQIDASHARTLRRVTAMNEQIGAGQTRAASMAENNPALHENPSVAAIRQGRMGTDAPGSALAGTRSQPTALPPGAVPGSVDPRREAPASIDAADDDLEATTLHHAARSGIPFLEHQAQDEIALEVSEWTELELSDVEEIPLP